MEKYNFDKTMTIGDYEVKLCTEDNYGCFEDVEHGGEGGEQGAERRPRPHLDEVDGRRGHELGRQVRRQQPEGDAPPGGDAGDDGDALAELHDCS